MRRKLLVDNLELPRTLSGITSVLSNFYLHQLSYKLLSILSTNIIDTQDQIDNIVSFTFLQLVPTSCCKTDSSKYPVIVPDDGHCIYVPTNYNSHWNKVGSRLSENGIILQDIYFEIKILYLFHYWQ